MHVKATDTHDLYASMFLENLSAARFVLSDTRTNGKNMHDLHLPGVPLQ